ncbi:MAG: metallophosphoesterase, partial [Nanoarchaeota archaeon]|nr:metallophosphoesterase [Nanoarchaeota archaeon]
MKILAVSDIHGDLGLVKKLEKMIEKENIDLIILAGDQTWFEQSTKNLVGPLTKKPTLIIPSNHETEGTVKMWEKMYPNLKSIHKKNWKLKDVGFFGSGTMDWGFDEDSDKIFKE